jgi:hypothetical protein
MATILSDEEVFAQFNQDSRKAYKRSWAQFVEFNPEQKQESDDFMFEMEEDPGMYAAAGLPPPTPYVSTSNGLTCKPMDPETAIKNVMKSVADIQGSNTNIKLVVVTANNGTMNF